MNLNYTDEDLIFREEVKIKVQKLTSVSKLLMFKLSVAKEII